MHDPEVVLPRLGNDPIAVLHHEHAVMRTALRAMANEANAMLAGGAIRAEFWRRVVEFLEHFLDRCHHEKEEQILFPALERHGFGREHGPLVPLRHEHVEGRRMVRVLLEALNERDAQRLASTCLLFCRREELHVEREDSTLLPMAMEVLSEDERRALVQQFDAHRDTIDPLIYVRCLAIGKHLARETGAEFATI